MNRRELFLATAAVAATIVTPIEAAPEEFQPEPGVHSVCIGVHASCVPIHKEMLAERKARQQEGQ